MDFNWPLASYMILHGLLVNSTESILIYSNRTVKHSIKAVRFTCATLIEQSVIKV